MISLLFWAAFENMLWCRPSIAIFAYRLCTFAFFSKHRGREFVFLSSPLFITHEPPMMEPGLQHTVCELLLFAFSVFQHRRSLMLSDKVRCSFFLGAFILRNSCVCDMVWYPCMYSLFSGGLLDYLWWGVFDVCTKWTGYGRHPLRSRHQLSFTYEVTERRKSLQSWATATLLPGDLVLMNWYPLSFDRVRSVSHPVLLRLPPGFSFSLLFLIW